MSYTLKYGARHEALLKELGIENLDAARKAYAEYDGDFIGDNLVPYLSGAATDEQEETAEDLITMLTAWEPGQTEQEYGPNYDDNNEEDDACYDDYDEEDDYDEDDEYFERHEKWDMPPDDYIEGWKDFPMCNHVKEVGPENIGYTRGMLSNGIPFEAELYSYGEGDNLMVSLGIMMPDMHIEPGPDYRQHKVNKHGADSAVGSRVESGKFVDEVHKDVVKNLGVLPIGMMFRGIEDNIIVMMAYLEFFYRSGIVRHTSNIRDCSLFYYTDLNGNDVVEAHISLIDHGRELATTELEFRPFPIQKNPEREEKLIVERPKEIGVCYKDKSWMFYGPYMEAFMEAFKGDQNVKCIIDWNTKVQLWENKDVLAPIPERPRHRRNPKKIRK